MKYRNDIPVFHGYLDALSATFLVRQLPSWFENVGKRQVKAPKVYIRDSGMLHGLLHLADPQRLEEHPKLGASWEGFALEQVLQITGDRDAYFWATHGGAELDLMVLWQGRRIGFEFKFGDAPGITKSMRVAMADLKLDRLLVVVPGKESYDLGPKMEVVSILNLVERLGRMAQELRLRDFIASRSRGGWTPPAASLTVLSKDAEPVRWGQGTAFQSFNLC